MKASYFFHKKKQACREIFQNQQTATKGQRDHVEKVCNDNNTNMKVLNCVKQFTDLTPINNSKQCKDPILPNVRSFFSNP